MSRDIEARRKIRELPIVKRISILAERIINRPRPILDFINYALDKRLKILLDAYKELSSECKNEECKKH